jgi:hypothetical protein
LLIFTILKKIIFSEGVQAALFQRLGNLPGGLLCRAYSISADGCFLLGQHNISGNWQPLRSAAIEGIVSLFDKPANFFFK